MEANLLEQLIDYLHFRNLECCLNARYLKVSSLFVLAVAVSDILKVQMCDLTELGQGH